MPKDNVFKCCNKKIAGGTLKFLRDTKDFTARKMLIGKCDYCGAVVAVVFLSRISDGKIFIDYYKGNEAKKTIIRENDKVISEFPEVKADKLFGWVYGRNIQIKNKKGEVVELRQYSSDFNGKKQIVKKIKNVVG